jgi:hypothetical protein
LVIILGFPLINHHSMIGRRAHHDQGLLPKHIL